MKSIKSLILIIFICGCVLQQSTEEKDLKDLAIASCKSLCKAALESNRYLENGPCLSDSKPDWEPNWNVSNWVCDIAHYPREPIDNLQENQCNAFREGKAQHFVELYPNCSLIRVE